MHLSTLLVEIISINKVLISKYGNKSNFIS